MVAHPPSSLEEISAGKRVLVKELRGGKDFVGRMAALGFTEGAEVQVVQNYRRGPLIAVVRGVRVALGRGEALKVVVEVVRHDRDAVD